MEGAGVCLTISTELCRERDSGGVGTTGKPQKSWDFLFSFFSFLFFPLSALETVNI